MTRAGFFGMLLASPLAALLKRRERQPLLAMTEPVVTTGYHEWVPGGGILKIDNSSVTVSNNMGTTVWANAPQA